MKQTYIDKHNITVRGDGAQTILMAHGFGCDQNMFRFITPSFERDYKIVLFDLVGCGRSDLSAYRPDKYSNLQGYAQDIVDFCKALELEDIIFVGHSVSATIGTLAYTINPNLFSKLVLICPSPRYINEEGYFGGFEQSDLEELIEVMENNYDGWASFLAPVVLKNEDKPDLVEELKNSFKSIDPEITQNFAKATFFSDNRKDLRKVNAPTLILQCQEDSIAPVEVGTYVQGEIPNSTLVMMKATGHCPHMTHPEETADAILTFLAASEAA